MNMLYKWMDFEKREREKIEREEWGRFEGEREGEREREREKKINRDIH